MLLTREEMTFDFGGAQLEPERDREILEWIFNQFLYGEVTGIQCGEWLYNAPSLHAAKFLARQSLEEMQHVDNFLRILAMLGAKPKPPHPAVRFLATGMMGNDWAEHVALEMAQGEGFVLLSFYAIIDTLNHKPTVDILKRAVKQEERHVAFGEEQTQAALAADPRIGPRLLGLSLVSLFGVARIAGFMQKRLPADHPVLRQLPAFLQFANRCAETRLRRLGLLDRPLAEVSATTKSKWVATAYAHKAKAAALARATKATRRLRMQPATPRLTDTYLKDPRVVAFAAEVEDEFADRS